MNDVSEILIIQDYHLSSTEKQAMNLYRDMFCAEMNSAEQGP
jgi:hypothetical protein